eukprot:CAMPEP_0113870822 /NCGR_PEP_ID=MMETSP0780_2-20120614/2297_1 /TAXON_ID=652834 /ORGANISM="Palpitomonas bilix" /LENGTH=310 /DNA_ID=CAMNT_0000856137 /DNA_START=38 /DNA_END=970 /DNA_ORIENTATION=- /assembly_acc=CAM_ASM_000599
MTSQKEAVEEAYPGVQAVPTLEELLRLDIDLVVVAAPNSEHGRIAIQVLNAGKHCVVDKPFAISLEEADAMLAAEKQSGKVLSVYQNRRWDADFRQLTQLIGSGKLGDVVSFESRFDRYKLSGLRGWKGVPGPGTGILYDLGPHLIDQALVLFGVPEWVEGDLFTHAPDGKVHDGFCIRMGWSQKRASLSASTVAADHDLRFLVHGTKGSLRKVGLDSQEASLRNGVLPTAEGFGVEDEGVDAVFTDGETGKKEILPSTEPGVYRSFYDKLWSCIANGESAPVTSGEGRNTLVIIDAVEKSHSSGKRIYL